MRQSLLPTCGTPVSRRRSFRNRGIQQPTCAPPGTRATPFPLRYRKRIEEAFGWAKTVEGAAQTAFRGIDRARAHFIMTLAEGHSPGCRSCLPHEQKMTLPADQTRQPGRMNKQYPIRAKNNLRSAGLFQHPVRRDMAPDQISGRVSFCVYL